MHEVETTAMGNVKRCTAAVSNLASPVVDSWRTGIVMQQTQRLGGSPSPSDHHHYKTSDLMLLVDDKEGYRIPYVRARRHGHTTSYVDLAIQFEQLNHHLGTRDRKGLVCMHPRDEEWKVQQMLSGAAKAYWAGKHDLMPSRPAPEGDLQPYIDRMQALEQQMEVLAGVARGLYVYASPEVQQAARPYGLLIFLPVIGLIDEVIDGGDLSNSSAPSRYPHNVLFIRRSCAAPSHQGACV
ncbi:MAG: hypothetical protein M1830_003740 [Pleopsidium flavum]|nr:MAG: hypothetical protein M1830_003740 [Pleopsidium flavum]